MNFLTIRATCCTYIILTGCFVAVKVHKDPAIMFAVTRAIVFRKLVKKFPCRVFTSSKLFSPVLEYASPIEGY